MGLEVKYMLAPIPKSKNIITDKEIYDMTQTCITFFFFAD